MKHSARNPYDGWTPDLQVQALKRCTYAVFIATFGTGSLLLSTWFELSVALDIMLFFCMIVSFTVAGIVYASTGMMSSSEPYGLVRFSDEYCREIIFKGYRAVAWWLTALLLMGFILGDILVSSMGFEAMSISKTAGIYILLTALIWAGSVSRALSDNADEDTTEEARD
ncbi:hypothetical protein [Aliidiomarina soli]|uniref:Uncharacterized protein n=1 Tax=Aliidiomarina soli TaxID=1928574 RepID=A0A432WE08_9GAMM|nr:hypothetical protein [Aliidiomarina soli]RUO31109.1 hypothetical protein CWE14_11465 [Aliidiomarina soli]